MKHKKLALMLAILLAISPVIGMVPELKAQDVTNPAIEINTEKWSIISKSEQTPVIDGTLDEPMWQEAQTLDHFVTAYYHEATEADTEVKLFYDDDYLYIGVSHEDHADSLANVDILLSTDASGDSYHYIPVAISDPGHPISNDWGPNKQTVTDYTAEIAHHDHTIIAEIAVPFTALGVDDVGPGDEWRFNALMQHKMDTQPLSSWVPIRTASYFSSSSSEHISMYANVTDEGRMGSLFLAELPAEWVANSAKDMQQVSPWEPQQISFSYNSFTEKELSFKIEDFNPQDAYFRLKWKAPNGTWVDIAQPQSKKEGEFFNLSFQHPEPTEKGTYQLLMIVSEDDGTEAKATILTFDQLSLIRAGDLLFAEGGDSGEEKTPVTPAPPSDEIEKLLELIPEKNGFRTVGLPDNPDLRPIDVYHWSPSDPWVLTSPHSDLTYPNEEYPEDQVFIVHNRKGEAVEYPYHEDENGKRYFISANLWYHQKKYVAGEMPRIAAEDPLGAARLFYKFAQMYEGYVLTHERDWKIYPIDPSTGPPYPYYGGNAWYWWSPAALSHLRYLADAYAIVKQTDAFDVLSEEVGENVGVKVVEDMFKPSVEYARTFPILNTNMDYHNWLGFSDLGRALNDPSYIHEAVERVEDYVTNTYLFDGFFKETTLSYHRQSTGGLDQAINSLGGWTDPEGYVSPRSGTRLDDLDMREKFPALQKSKDIPNLLAYPNGKYLPTQDTWAFQETSNPHLDAGSFLLPASGIVRLARGTGDQAEDAYGKRYKFNELEVIDATLDTRYLEDREALLFRNNQGPGHYVTFTFEVDETDDYEIDLQAYKATSYGVYDIKIDGESIGEYNFYTSVNGPGEFDTLATKQLKKGPHTITFESVGKDEQSSDYYMSVMRLMLLDEQAQRERDEAEQKEPAEADPTQLYLTFQPRYGHHHFDPLNLTLFGKDQELLPDIGYTHTFYRRWTNSTLAHNTVVVDGEDMDVSGAAKDGGNIDVFVPMNEQVQVTRAEGKAAYSQTDEYSREPWLIQFPDAEKNDGYVLDLFRVSGGDRHEYTLQGDANHDASFETDLTLSEYGPYLLPDGTTVTEPVDQYDTGNAEGHYYGYIYVRDVERAAIEDGQYDLTLVTEDDGGEKAKMKITGLVDPGQNELFLGESPSLRATRLYGTSMDNNNEAVKYTMPKMVLRREGTDLTSHFITALEPYANDADPRIERIEKLTPEQAVEGDLAVQVTYGDTTDIILSSLAPSEPLIVGDMTLHGKMGLIRLQDGHVQDMYLVGGTLLKKGEVEITDPGPVTGTVTDVRRQAAGDGQDAFITDTLVPADLAGNTLVITHPDGKTHGYEIDKVTTENGQSIIEIADMDPGFTIDPDGTSALKFFPFTEWAGVTTFRIENTLRTSVERDVSVATLQDRIEYFKAEGAFTNDRATHALKIHLTAVGRFEEQEVAEKVVKHMKGFKLLLDHQKDTEVISEEAYNALQSDVESMIKQWQ